jgi:crossover junction endodeoxyribonuclease RuvC
VASVGSIIGIDPGVSGAIAFVSEDGELQQVFDMPVFKIKGKSKLDVHQLGTILRQAGEGRAVIELVGAMPGQGVTSMFTFGFATGALHGAVGALSMPLETVTPQKWKAHFRLGKDKDEARQLATRKWPHGPFSRVKDAGRAEAALIALYAIETNALKNSEAK